MNNFWQRAITGTVFVAVLISAILLGGWYMHITFGLVVMLGLYEFYNLFSKSEIQPQKYSGTFFGTAIYFLVLLGWYYGDIFIPPILGVFLLFFVIVAISELLRKKQKPFENIAVTITGILYITIPFLLLNVYSFEEPLEVETLAWPALSIFILIWSNDTFAYLTGRLIGKHKLFERISPKKTWEGFIGGVVFAILAGILLAYFLDQSYVKFITYAIVAGVVGTAGDLVESMLKRSVNVKDSGTILPGHGGILDRFDAVLFVVPVIFFLDQFIF